jgi:hypothetical protein
VAGYGPGGPCVGIEHPFKRPSLPAPTGSPITAALTAPESAKDAQRTDAERAAAGPMVAMDTIAATVSDLLADHTARGRMVVLR